MKKKFGIILEPLLIVCLLLPLLLGACAQSEAEQPTRTVPPVVAETSAPVPTNTATKPSPPTQAPEPTATVVPTETATTAPTKTQAPKEKALSEAYFLLNDGEKFYLTGPDFPYYIAFPITGFELQEDINIFNQGKSVGAMWIDEGRSLILSIFIEPATECRDSESCRDFIAAAQEQPGRELTDMETSNFNDYAVLEYTIPEVSGVQVNNRHFHAELVQDDHWIDIHLSKVDYQEGYEEIFLDFIESVEYSERISHLFEIAYFAYLMGDYQVSKEVYSEILNIGGPSAEILNLRADAYKKLGDYESAISDELGAVELGDSSPVLLNNICWDYGVTNQPELALPYCEEAVKAEPSAQYLDSRGLTYALLGDFEAAITDFQVVVDELEGATDPELTAIYTQRLAWIGALKDGVNPFTPEVLAELRGE